MLVSIGIFTSLLVSTAFCLPADVLPEGVPRISPDGTGDVPVKQLTLPVLVTEEKKPLKTNGSESFVPGNIKPWGVVKSTRKEILQSIMRKKNEGLSQLATATFCQSSTTVQHESGYVQTDDPYAENGDQCVVIDRSELLLVTFLGEIDIENHSNCLYDFLRIYQQYDLLTGTGSLVDTYCGNIDVPPMLLQGPLLIYFHTDASVSGSGFRLNWVTEDDDSVINPPDDSEESSPGDDVNPPDDSENSSNDNETGSNECVSLTGVGSVSSPNYPSSYPSNTNLCWSFNGQSIILSFHGFLLENFSSCSFDYFSITTFDGITTKYCGSNSPPSTSYEGPVTFRFYSDQIVQKSGFRFTYTTTQEDPNVPTTTTTTPLSDDECHVYTTAGSKSTSNYPNSYDNNDEWCIKLAGQAIYLNFESFRLESHSQCNYDYLSVTINGLTSRYCGSQPPSSGPYSGLMTLRFSSDTIVTRQGFRLHYSFVSTPPPTNPVFFTTTTITTPSSTTTTRPSTTNGNNGCEVVTSSGTKQTSNHPSNYNFNEDWCIVLQAEVVQLTFDSNFYIENHGSCVYDYVSITSSTVQQKYCGSTPPVIPSLQGPVTIAFHSDNYINKRGFILTYQLSQGSITTASPPALPPNQSECNSTLSGDGTVTSSNFPGDYYNNQDWCVVIAGDYISITFTSFEIESCVSCNCDYLSIESPQVDEKHCSFPPSTVYQGPVTIRFKSDYSVTKGGFRMTYTQATEEDIGGNPDNQGIPCGQAANPLQSIVGGATSQHGQWPWQVVLYAPSSRCGGSIIASRWVLTAAHCVVNSNDVAYPASQVRVVVGEHQRSINEGTEKSIYAENIYVHESYSSSPHLLYPNDIALIKLKKPITYNDYARPVCLRNTGVDSGVNCVASGWGSTIGQGSGSTENWDTLRHVTLQTRSRSYCRSRYGSRISDKHLCAHSTNKGICQGDSGGPLACSNNNIYYLHGVTSFSGTICASTPSGFTRVSSYINWIKTKTEGDVVVAN